MRSNDVLWNTIPGAFFRFSTCERLLDELPRYRSRNRHALVTADDHGINADDFTTCIDQRSAGVAGRERHVRANDRQFVTASILCRDQRTDNPTCNRIALSPRMAEGKDHFT